MTHGRGHVPFMLVHLQRSPWPGPLGLACCTPSVLLSPEAFQVRPSGKGVQLPRTLPLSSSETEPGTGPPPVRAFPSG